MHITEETFRSINLRKWEASQVCNELAALLIEAELNIEDYPALNTLFGGLQHIGDVEITQNIVQENQPGEAGVVITFEEETE